MKRSLLYITSVLVLSMPALAQNTTQVPPTDVTAENTPAKTKCFPVKSVTKLLKKTQKIKASKQDTLGLMMLAKFQGANELATAPRFYSKSDDQIHDFTILPDGAVEGFHEHLITLDENSELCGEVMTPGGETPKIGLSMGSEILFKNRTGPYTLAELQDGVADGKSWYKRMFPGPLAIMVPKMSHIMIDYEDKSLGTNGIIFTKSGVVVATPKVETFGNTYVISLGDIEASGADQLSIQGGAFLLSPVPSVEKMKSLGLSTGDEDADANDD